jgi:hypothetical protein
MSRMRSDKTVRGSEAEVTRVAAPRAKQPRSVLWKGRASSAGAEFLVRASGREGVFHEVQATPVPMPS